MELTDTQIGFFDRKILRVDPEKLEIYRAQVDHLVGSLEEKIKEDETFGVIKFLKAGSLRKGTALQPRDGRRVDADVAVYLDVADTTEFDLETLHDRIRRLLIAIYPNKKPEDFEIQPRTLGITFHESGLDIDLVPVLYIPGPGDYGLQPSSRGHPPVRTSIPRQLEFFRRRADQDSRFPSLVRLVKRWRDHQELEALRSFPLELLLAHIQDAQGSSDSLEAGLLRFFLFVAQTNLAAPVNFPENGKVSSYPTGPVVVLDPANSENNVTRQITAAERAETVGKATDAWEALTTARRNNYQGETLEYWKEVFGRSFVVGD